MPPADYASGNGAHAPQIILIYSSAAFGFMRIPLIILSHWRGSSELVLLDRSLDGRSRLGKGRQLTTARTPVPAQYR